MQPKKAKVKTFICLITRKTGYLFKGTETETRIWNSSLFEQIIYMNIFRGIKSVRMNDK